MESIIKSGGKQYLVKKDDEILVEKISGDQKEIEFDDLLSGKKVKAKILGDEKAEKISILKFKPKKRYLKRQGHRQTMTRIKIYE